MPASTSAPRAPVARTADDQMQAWLALVVALAVHVADEALTGFLDFYNPLVESLRERLGWWPMPTFEFAGWLSGLIVLIVILALLAPAVSRGAPGTALAAWIFSAIMFANGVGHLVGSVYFGRWLPGATSAPLLIVASIMLARRTSARAGEIPTTERGQSPL